MRAEDLSVGTLRYIADNETNVDVLLELCTYDMALKDDCVLETLAGRGDLGDRFSEIGHELVLLTQSHDDPIYGGPLCEGRLVRTLAENDYLTDEGVFENIYMWADENVDADTMCALAKNSELPTHIALRMVDTEDESIQEELAINTLDPEVLDYLINNTPYFEVGVLAVTNRKCSVAGMENYKADFEETITEIREEYPSLVKWFVEQAEREIHAMEFIGRPDDDKRIALLQSMIEIAKKVMEEGEE